MKNTKKYLGEKGEEVACNYLQNLGYKILEKNWRFRKAEIDIICEFENVLIFVEVKSKSYTFYGDPEESISKYKEDLIIDAATQFMVKVGHEWEIRFDIISILFHQNKGPQLKHYQDAFFPGI